MRVVGLAAVSSKHQADKVSIPQQVEQIAAVCAQRGWRLIEQVTLPGQSRNYLHLHELMDDSPEYARFMRIIESGQVDLIVVRDYDRLARTEGLGATVQEIAESVGVQVYAYNQPVEPVPLNDAERAGGSGLIAAIYRALAKQENKTKTRRMRDGMMGRVQKGYHANTVPLGYRLKDGVCVPEPTEAEWVRWMYGRRTGGWGWLHIAAELRKRNVPTHSGGLWHAQTVITIVRNPFYKGYVRYSGRVYRGVHEPLVDEETWHTANARKKGYAHAQRVPKALTGLCRCGYCGYAMVYHKHTRGYYRLICSRYNVTQGIECRCNSHKAEPIEDLVKDAVRRGIEHPDEFLEWASTEDSKGDLYAERDAVDRQLKEQDRRYRAWERLVESEDLPPALLADKYREMMRDKEALEARRAELDHRVVTIDSTAKTLVDMSSFLQSMNTLTDDELRGVYDVLVEAVYLERGKEPRIRWKLGG